MSEPHHEKEFQKYIVAQLEAMGWLVGTTNGYDTENALFTEDVLAWVKATQPKSWEKLEATHKGKALDALTDRLAKALEKDGTVQVLRGGFQIAGAGHFDMSEAAPEDLRNQGVLDRYKANRLRVVPELEYHPAHGYAIDLVFFINGIPVGTTELKTDFTQAVEDAMEQYRNDRKPYDPVTKRKEPLLTFKRGAVVHFAMSDSDIRMATKLDGENTYFLPFNSGNNGHAGNAAREDKDYPVAYFWRDVLKPDAWLRIFHSFVYVEKKDVVDLHGNWTKKETLIFPRFHQWSAVNSMIEDAKANGPGMAYLCEHSAGSGKTSTIAWTAHDLIKLRHDDGKAYFDSVIIVTDRTVLDSQLQDAVKQIDCQFGVIAAIDRDKSSKSKSKQLTEAISSGIPIIVVTIQTFPYAMEAILTAGSLKDKHFAVIIDEAHNSQTGTNASKLQAVLALQSKDAMAAMTVEDLLEHIQKSRVRPKNISHFAFTATPKHSTLMLFGRPKDPSQPSSKDNLPESFHKYPMRQAIEEGFILDVLQNYVPYKTAYNLSEQLGKDKRVNTRQARRALAQWMALHPTNVTQKVQLIVEHFSKNVAHLLDGKAKAMVVTSSRAAAVRYKKGFDAYIMKHPEHAGIRALVAFSGKLTAKQVNHPADEHLKGDDFKVAEDEEFTELNMNPDTKGADLRAAFDRPEYRVMLVADKFQTGFDQPKLVAMYIDKKIANEVEIVQTLSRLNRTAPGKDGTFVIDFVNDPDSVRLAFAKYDSGAQIIDVQDLNVVYEIKAPLDKAGIYDEKDLDAFREARFKAARGLTSGAATTHKELYAATQHPTEIYNQKLKMLKDAVKTSEAAYQDARAKKNKDAMKAADHQRADYAAQMVALVNFKNGLGRFCRTYSYVAQLIDFGDPELENYAAFAKLLSKRLDGISPDEVDLKGLLLTGFGILDRKNQPVKPDQEDLVLPPVGPGGEGKAHDPDFLADIIKRMNAIFGKVAPIKDLVALTNQVTSIARENDTVMAQVENNTRDQTMKGNLPGAIEQAVVRALTSHQAAAKLLLKSDQQSMSAFTHLIYDILKVGREIDLEAS